MRFVELCEVGSIEDIVGWGDGSWCVCIRCRVDSCSGKGNECGCGERDETADYCYRENYFVEDDGEIHVA